MSKRAPIRLVLADIDGTLLTKDKVLTQRTCRAVHALRAAGIMFAITSGRPPRGMSMLIKPLQVDTPVAGFNGGVLVNPDMSIIEKKRLAEDSARLAVELIDKHGLGVWLFTVDQWFITDAGGAHVARETSAVQFKPTVVADLSPYLPQAVKIVGVSDNLGIMQKCEAETRSALAKQAAIARSQPYYLDVTHEDANKGAVVETLARMLEIPTSSIASIGDQSNDILMFAKSGLGIAMGNAPDKVKERADFVTSSNEDEGFANAMQQFVLNRSAD